MRLEKRAETSHNDESVTLDELVKGCLEAWRERGNASEKTLRHWSAALGHVTSKLGSMAIGSITPQAIESCYVEIRTQNGLSGTTMHKIHWLLSRAFATAVGTGLISENPCDKVLRPTKNVPMRKSLSAEQSLELRQNIDDLEKAIYAELGEREERRQKQGRTVWRTRTVGLSDASMLIAVRLALATGMRAGEIIELDWESVDLEQRQLHVTKDGSASERDEDRAIRTIHIDENTTAHLARWKERLALEFERLSETRGRYVAYRAGVFERNIPRFPT